MARNLNNEIAMGFIGLLNPGFAAKMAEAERRHERATYERLKKTQKPVQWDDLKTGFEKLLFVSAKSWNPVRLFTTPPMEGLPGESMTQSELRKICVRCPGTNFLYANHVLPEGYPLSIANGVEKRGQVYFDGPVTHPVLYEVTVDGPQVWMGLTPFEVFTQRPGLRLARGRVVIGGLGLGWFLDAVCRRPAVTEVVLVERSEILLDWMLPRIEKAYPAVKAKKVNWVCDDVYAFMEADAANHQTTRYLLDIWPRYLEYDRRFEDWKGKLGSNLWGWGMYAERMDRIRRW
jgi:hypothetical protein